MTQESGTTDSAVEVGDFLASVPVKSGTPPAPGAEEKKPTEVPAAPASEAEDKTSETADTPEQVEQKRESRRARSNARKAAALAAAQTEAKMLRERLEKLEAEKRPPADPQEPKREDFQDYETYLRATAKFDAEQVTAKTLKADRESRETAEKQSGAKAEHEKLAKDWNEREQAFQAATKDYVESVQPFIEEGLGTLSDAARRAIAESDLGPQLLYHLSQNDEVAEKLAEMPPLQQVKELGKLEAKFPQAEVKPKGKAVSSAPAPIKPVAAGRSAGHGYSENMTDAEYREWRKGQGARWAR